jgi:CMP-N-acetylneuraminic acid synthetase
MSKKKWRDRKQTPIFVFTVQTVDLVLKAVALFEQPLQRADRSNEKVMFADETIRSVKQKLERMKHSVGAICLTGFDYNEKIIIRHAMLVYTIDLLDENPSPQRDRELRQCRIIAEHFTDKAGVVG